MHWRLSIGAAFNAKHIQEDRKRRRRAMKLFDPFQGEISGVNFNGVHILQLYAEGTHFEIFLTIVGEGGEASVNGKI